MPIIKASGKLIFYAHVPKCAGSTVEVFLKQRFGPLAFHYNYYLQIPPHARWSRTSPQHVDRQSLAVLFPKGFFDESFAIVRHPVARLVSAFHFHSEVTRQIPPNVGFSEWLADLPELRADNPFAHDNHSRPMDELVPEDARIFYIEHGVDLLVPWFDQVLGTVAGPRTLPHVNKRADYGKSSAPKVSPSQRDIDMIAAYYAQDFRRFGYEPDRAAPLAPVPESPDQVARGGGRPAPRGIGGLIHRLRAPFAR